MKFITQNQEAQTKLRARLKAAFASPSSPSLSPSPLPSVGDVLSKEIPYLDATMQETLRCACTVGRLSRVAMVDTEVLGYKIPAGTVVAPLPAVQWHPVPVPEALRSSSSRAALEKSGGLDWTQSPSARDLEQFAPERWLRADEMGNEVFDAGALPQNSFGGGMRGCFGEFYIHASSPA